MFAKWKHEITKHIHNENNTSMQKTRLHQSAPGTVLFGMSHYDSLYPIIFPYLLTINGK